MEGGLGQFDAIYNILILVVIITLIARQINFPSTIAFIFAGLLAAAVPRLPLPELSPEIFLSILLPPILFTETLTLDIDGLIDDSDTILSYALPGTLLVVSAIGVYTHYVFQMGWLEAFMLGIVVAKFWFRSTHFSAASGPPGRSIRPEVSASKPYVRAAGAMTFIATRPMPALLNLSKEASLLPPTMKL